MIRRTGQIGVVVLAGVIFFLGLGWAQDYLVRFPMLAGETIELTQGRWALLFVVLPDCPACVKVLGWLGRVVPEFPKIRFAVVAPKITPELVASVEANVPGMPVVHDRGGVIGGGLGVKRAPTFIVLVEGILAGRLDWRFSQEDMRRELSRSLEIKALSDLLGEPAPDFRALGLSGEPVTFAELPRPVLLVFFNPSCPPCWEVLPALAKLPQEVRVVVLVLVGEANLSPTDRTRLEAFVRERKEKPVTVLIVSDPDVLWMYGAPRSPSFIVVDRKGVISWVWSGLIKNDDLVAAVRVVLAGNCMVCPESKK